MHMLTHCTGHSPGSALCTIYSACMGVQNNMYANRPYWLSFTKTVFAQTVLGMLNCIHVCNVIVIKYVSVVIA